MVDGLTVYFVAVGIEVYSDKLLKRSEHVGSVLRGGTHGEWCTGVLVHHHDFMGEATVLSAGHDYWVE